jgi:hypothetical protein
VLRLFEADLPLIAKDNPPLAWIGLACIQHADYAQFSRCPGEASSSPNDLDNVAIICNCVNARERANLIRGRCCILRKYCVAGLGYPMMVHICDGGITRREAEDVNANPSCKITSSGAQSSKYK